MSPRPRFWHPHHTFGHNSGSERPRTERKLVCGRGSRLVSRVEHLAGVESVRETRSSRSTDETSPRCRQTGSEHWQRSASAVKGQPRSRSPAFTAWFDPLPPVLPRWASCRESSTSSCQPTCRSATETVATVRTAHVSRLVARLE